MPGRSDRPALTVGIRQLKAGLDGLRTHKAAAEANQQKLLARLETLKTELGDDLRWVFRHRPLSQHTDGEQVARLLRFRISELRVAMALFEGQRRMAEQLIEQLKAR